MSQGTKRGRNRDLNSQGVPNTLQNLQCPTSPLQAAMQGIALLLNSHLSTTELDLCIELLRAEVHPKALADVVLPLLKARKEKPVPVDQ